MKRTTDLCTASNKALNKPMPKEKILIRSSSSQKGNVPQALSTTHMRVHARTDTHTQILEATV